MKYLFGVLYIVFTGQIVAINLSALLNDENVTTSQNTQTETQNQSTDQPNQNNTVFQHAKAINFNGLLAASKNIQEPRKAHTDVVHNMIIFDPNFQKATNILWNENTTKMYEDYLQSIHEFFISYALTHVQSVSLREQRKSSINLAALKSTSNDIKPQVTDQKSDIDISSLLNTTTTAVTPNHKNVPVNVDALLNTADDSVTQTKPVQRHTMNFSGLEEPGTTQISNQQNAQQPEAGTQKKKVLKKDKKRLVNLSSLLNQS